MSFKTSNSVAPAAQPIASGKPGFRWRCASWLAKNFGCFTYGAPFKAAPTYAPMGWVESDDGYSGPLPLGDAWQYARHLGGRVVENAPDWIAQ